jgi:hypothetical protein
MLTTFTKNYITPKAISHLFININIWGNTSFQHSEISVFWMVFFRKKYISLQQNSK